MTEAELLAAKHARAATVPLDEWILRVRRPGYRWRSTEWGKALIALEQLRKPATPPPPVPAPPPSSPASIFAGKGLFTTNDATTASGLNSDWVAVQMDAEGDPSPTFNNNPGRLCYWQARPTQAVVDQAWERGIPYIGQAENQLELDRCLSLNTHGLVAKAIVGNAGSWATTWNGASLAVAQNWDLIQEMYTNAQPWLTSPDAAHYPRFVNVCFGTYDASGEHPDVGGRVSLEAYRAMWSGSFSCWSAEGMTPDDRTEYNRA